MRSARARRRAVNLRPPAALGALSLSVVGLTALPAAAAQGTPAAEAVAPLSVAADGTVTIDILDIADFHGALAQAPGLADLVTSIRADNPDTAFVSAGDNIGGSTFESAIAEDEPTIEVLDEMSLVASAVGNHEFDRGYADLSGRVADLASFEYLGANVEGESPDLPSYELWEAPAGVTVGFVGAVTTTTPEKVSPSGIAGLTFTDEAPAVNATAAQLSDGDDANGEADIVVALVHEGAGDALTGGMSDDVDALFTGHSHFEVNTAVDGMPVLQTVNGGESLARLTLEYDPATGEVTTVEQSILPVPTYDPEEGIVTLTDGTEVPIADFVGGNATVQDVVDTVDDAFADAAVLGGVEVGTVTASFDRGTNDGTDTGANRGTESTLGNMVADSLLWKAGDLGQDADLGVINPGGLRADLDPDGDGIVTYAEVATVSPFGNTLTMVDLTGAQLVTMLEQQWLQPADEDHPVLRLGLSRGVQYYYDPTAEDGSHVLRLEIDGEPVDPDETYTVATINFLAEGGDNFDVFTESTNINDTGYVDRESLVDYLGANADLAPDYTQRSIGMTWLSDPDATFSGGEEVSLELSSLSFTSDEPKPEAVTVLMDGTEIGEFPIDNTVTPSTDETGRATVTFTAPDLSGYDDGDAVTFELVFGATEDSMQTIPLTLEVLGDDGPTTDDGSLETLPETGAETTVLGAASAALVLLGILTMVAARRRTA